MQYEYLSFLEKDKQSISGEEMLKRAKKLNAEGTQEDLKYILSHQNEIPEEMKGEYIVFTKVRHPNDSEDVAYVYWRGGGWVQDWHWLGGGWDGNGRVLRRKSDTRSLGTLESRVQELESFKSKVEEVLKLK